MPVTDAGYVRKTQAEFFSEIIAECRATVDPEFDDAPDSVTGQIVGIMSDKYAEGEEVMEAVFNALSENASGAALDRIAALTNTFRRADESDADLRLRRRNELADQGATTDSAIRAALSRLAGMKSVSVTSNRTMATDLAGRPPKSVEALVLGSSDSNLIAQTIYQNLAAGIQAYGTTIVAVTDSEARSQEIGYSVAEPVTFSIRIVCAVSDASYAGDEILKQTIIDFSAGKVISTVDGRTISGGVALGGTLYRSRFAAAALTVAGVITVEQVLFKGPDAGASFVNADVSIGDRKYLGQGGVRGFIAENVEVATT